MTDPGHHPVVEAIAAEHERLQNARLDVVDELARLDRELEVLESARTLIVDAAGDSTAERDGARAGQSSPKARRGRSTPDPSPAPAPTPAAATSQPSAQAAQDRLVRVLAFVDEHPGSTLREIFDGIDSETAFGGFRQFFPRVAKSLRRERDGKTFRYYPATGSTPAPPGPNDARPGPRPPEVRTPVDEGPGDRERGHDGHNGTLDGRILSILQTSRPTITELEVALGVDRVDLDKAVSRLMRDGDVRTNTDGDKRVLVPV